MTITSENWPIAPTRPNPMVVISACMEAVLRGRDYLRQRRRARADYCDLSAVAASTLKDIGIDRSEIMSLTLGDSSGRRRTRTAR